MDTSYLVEVISCENGTLLFDHQELIYAVETDGHTRYLKDFEEPLLVFRQGHRPHLALDRRHANSASLWPRGTKGFVMPLPEIKSALPM